MSMSGSFGLATSPSQGAAPPPPNALGPAVMMELTKALARHLGPIAKVVLKEELKKLGVTAHTVARPQFEDLVHLLTRRIPDPNSHKEFAATVSKLVTR